ncbi:MAG: phospholipase effector Tle1 domain-containing protein, partial [Candidatus Binatia bacterium]
VLGGAFGVGGKERINEAISHLSQSCANGDRAIDIVGFSRGAALALHFANTIAHRGILDPETGKVTEPHPKIRFLGLWDVVAAFGIPIDIGIPFSRINLGYWLTLPGNVAHCFHALALDERRQAFRPTRTQGGYQVWFRGVHSDIGGGNENLALNNISLRWMLKKGLAVGLPIKQEALAELDIAINPEAKIGRNFDPISNRPRDLRPDDRIHYTVSRRPGDGHNNPPANAPVEGPQDEAARLS